jgi:integrase
MWQRGKMRDGIRKMCGRDGSISYMAKVAARDPGSGKVVPVQATFATRKEAETWRDSQRSARGDQRFVFPDSATVSEWLDLYLTAQAAKDRTTTQERNAGRAKHIKACLGQIKLQSLSADMIQGFNSALERKGFAPRSRRSILVTLKAALSHAVARGKLKSNPFAAVEMPTPDDGETVYALSASDVETILRVFSDSELWLGVAVLAYTGLRRGELYALRWRSIDFERGTLHVGGTVARTAKNGLTIEAPKSKASRRTIPIDAAILAELRRHKTAQAAIALQLGLAQSDAWLIFPAAPDRPTEPKNPSGFCQGFKHKLQRTSYAHISPHDLRHAHGSILINAGESLITVAARLGHSVMVCGTTYAHELRGREAAQVKFPVSVAKCGMGLSGAPSVTPQTVPNLLKEKAA